MYLLYSTLLTIGFIIMLPRLAIDARRNRKYVTGLRERLGNGPHLAGLGRRVIWLHCVSVGETEAARPLVRALRQSFPSYLLVISTTTVTGQKVARRAFAQDAAAIIYFPIDFAWTIRRVLNHLAPAMVLIMETELWPNLLRQCRRRSIPVAVVNGRISDRSFRRYRRLGGFIRRVLNDVAIAAMQSDADADRIRDLGMDAARVFTSGNLKFDSVATAVDPSLTTTIRERFGFNQNERLIVAASTHAPEESIGIEAFNQVRKSGPGERVRLLIAPRHPERFDEVAEQLATSGCSWTRRSSPPATTDTSCDVVLLDSIGELRAVLPLADVAFIGGSIAPHGGHNVLEATAQAVCVVTGAHTRNFDAITRVLLSEDAMVQLRDVPFSEAPAELAQHIVELLQDQNLRQSMAARARAVSERNRGATERTVAAISRLLESTERANETIPFPAIHVTAAK